MWYVKHPFDCIVVGLVLSEMAGLPPPPQPPSPGSASQTARGQGGLFPHTAVWLWRQRPSCSRADVRAEECGKQSTLGGLVLPP